MADALIVLTNTGHNTYSKEWDVKWKSTTKAKISVEHLEVHKKQFLLDIKMVVNSEVIPNELILNWAINYVPVSNWTMAK